MIAYKCELCKLYQYSKCPKIEGRGDNKTPKIVLIGEAPRPDEAELGQVFIGRAGKLLNAMLLPYKDIPMYITNAVKCFPPISTTNPTKGFRVPKPIEIEYCHPTLLDELDAITTTPIIMPLGNTATTAILGKHNGITKEIGQIHNFVLDEKEYIVVPNYHPSYILRNPKMKPEFERVMQYVVQNVIPTM